MKKNVRGENMKEQKLVIAKQDFELNHIFECGQCFRWKKQSDQSYIGVFQNHVLQVKNMQDNIIFEGICDGDIKEVINHYFDMQTDYTMIKHTLSQVDSYLAKSIEYGHGIRILQQDLWEVIISFIISANNNIPRIQKIIERLAKEYGTPIIWKKTIYYAFPTPEQLAKASIEDLRRLGLGFRDKYVYETTRKILQKEIDLDQLTQIQDTNKVREILKRLPRYWTKSCGLYFTIWYASILRISY